MALKEYDFKTLDGRTETLLLNEEDAKLAKAQHDAAHAAHAARTGAADTDGTKAKRPANKAATPANKGAAAPDDK